MMKMNTYIFGGERRKPLPFRLLAKYARQAASLLLAVLLCVTMLPVEAFAAAAGASDYDIIIGSSSDGVTSDYHSLDTNTHAIGEYSVSKTYMFRFTEASFQLTNSSGAAQNRNTRANIAGMIGLGETFSKSGKASVRPASDWDDYRFADAEALTTAGYIVDSQSTSFYYIYFINLEYAVLIEITPNGSDPITIDTSQLDSALSGTGSYYESGDRYNGKTTVTDLVAELKENETIKADNTTLRVLDSACTGFWALYQAAMKRVDEIYPEASGTRALASGVTQREVDAVAVLLAAAKENRIPTTQVNATGLYEAVQAFRELDASKYTSGSWAVLSEAVAPAEAVLDELFDDNNAATEVNKAERQTEADALAAKASKKDVLVLKELYDPYYENYQARLQEARNLVEQYDPSRLAETDYTPKSWSAYESAWENLRSDVNYTFSGGIQADYWRLVNFQQHLDGLTSARLQLASSGDVTFTLTYVDNTRSNAPYTGELTLSSGSTTLADAMEAANLSVSGKGLLAVYLNGECIASFSPDKLGEATLQIPNKAEVKLVLSAMPKETEEGSSGYDSTEWLEHDADSSADYSDSFAQIGMAAPETAAVGDKVKITGSVTGASYSNLGQDLGGEGLTLFVSEPRQTEAFSAPSKETVTVTGADGTLEYVFTRPGWYTVALFDMREDVLTATDIFRETTIGTYYSLRAGDFALIHVTEAEDEQTLLEQYRTEKAAEAERFFAQYHDYDFTAEDYASFQSLYSTLRNNLTAAESFTALMDQYDKDYAALRAAAAEKAMDHEAVIANLRANLAYLPGDLSTMDSTYKATLEKVQKAYAGLNAHQKSLLTGNEVIRLDEVAKVDAGGLLEPASVTLIITGGDTLSYLSQSGGDTGSQTSSPNHNKTFTRNPDGSTGESEYKYAQYGEPEALSNVKAGQILELRRYIKQTDEYYWVKYSLDGGATWLLAEHWTPESSLVVQGEYFVITYTIPAVEAVNLQLGTFSKTEYQEYLTAQDAAGLEEAKESAKASLQATYDGYDLSLYDDEGQAALQKALEDGLKAIDEAATTTAVNEARQAALAAMASVKRAEQVVLPDTYDSGETVGQVHVIIENTTYDDAPFTGTIAKGWYDLGENDTMMTMVLKVLQSKGYSWNGTTDFGNIQESDYDITYLASITKGGETLAEFTGGQKSGWMGTLNDWFVNEGFQQFSYQNGQLQNNDEIRVMYTCDYGVDLGGTWGSNDTSLESLTIRGGTLTPSFDGDVTDYMLLISGERANVTVTPSAANKNYLVKTFLNTYNSDGAFYRRPETISVKSGDVIYVGVGEKGWPTMNTGGNPTRYTIQVYSLQEALNNLPDASAVTLGNYTTYGDTVRQLEDLIKQQGYTGDRSRLDALKERVTFYEEIDEVKDLLADIPDVDDLTTGDRGQVQDARDAYDALDEDQKLYITIADVEKYNAAVKWMEEHGSSISGGTIAGVEEMPEEIGETGGGSITITPEASVNSKGEATAKVDAETVEQVLEQAAEDGNISTIVVAPEIDGDASRVTVELPKSSVSDIAGDSLDLTVSTPIAGMTIPSDGLSELAKQSGSTVSFTAESVTVTGAEGNKSDAIRLDVAVNGKSVDTVPGGLTVTVPAADAGSVLVLVADDGTETIIRKSVTEDGEVAGLVDGSCTVKVVDNAKTFTDTSSHWAADAIDFASSRELFNGTSSTAFSPNEEMTRAMLVTVLHRMEDEMETAAENAFADIPDDTWYTDAVIWASENGIVNGVAEGQFDPNANITREQLAAMMYRYADFLGMDTAASGSLSRFNDGSQVSSWASDAMKWAVGNGLISGKSSTILDPKGNATRAEVATILQRMTALMVK